MCGAVADVSDRLIVSSETTAPGNLGVSLGSANNETVREACLPNGLFLVGSTTTCNLNVSWPHAVAANSSAGFLPARTSLAFSDQDGRVSSAIANFFLVYTSQASSDSQQGTVFRAAEVLLHFCVNTYQASTSRGVSTSAVVHSSSLAAQDGSSSSAVVRVRDVEAAPESSRRVLLRATAAAGQAVYSVERDDVKLLNSYVLSLFSGTYSYRYGKAIGGETATSEALGLAMFGGEPCDDSQMRAVVSNLTSNVATSLTNTQVNFLGRLALPLSLSLSRFLSLFFFFFFSGFSSVPESWGVSTAWFTRVQRRKGGKGHRADFRNPPGSAP